MSIMLFSFNNQFITGNHAGKPDLSLLSFFLIFLFLSKSLSNSCMEKDGYEEDFASVDANL